MNALKIVILGDFGVGKTSLVRRYVHDEFSGSYRATLGVHLYKHTDTVMHDRTPQTVRMVLWDIEGSPQPGAQTLRYLTGAAGALIVGDLTRSDMVDTMRTAAEMFGAKLPGRPIGFALNKRDLTEDPVPDVMTALYSEYGAAMMETSAKTGAQVLEIFRQVCRLALARTGEGG